MTHDPPGPRVRLGLLAPTLAVALVTSVGALVAVHQLARMVDKPGARLAALPAGVADPDTTGSIGPAARSVVLDPCNGRERLVVRGP